MLPEESKSSNELAVDRTKMAVKRTIMAADRSLMAWVRTGLSLISFGFTIYKFLEYEREQILGMGKHIANISSPKVIGLFMIGFGILSLVLGVIENIITIRNLREHYDFNLHRFSIFIAGCIAILGLVLFIGILAQVKWIS